jgi:hypothetical protein
MSETLISFMCVLVLLLIWQTTMLQDGCPQMDDLLKLADGAGETPKAPAKAPAPAKAGFFDLWNPAYDEWYYEYLNQADDDEVQNDALKKIAPPTILKASEKTSTLPASKPAAQPPAPKLPPALAPSKPVKSAPAKAAKKMPVKTPATKPLARAGFYDLWNPYYDERYYNYLDQTVAEDELVGEMQKPKSFVKKAQGAKQSKPATPAQVQKAAQHKPIAVVVPSKSGPPKVIAAKPLAPKSVIVPRPSAPRPSAPSAPKGLVKAPAKPVSKFYDLWNPNYDTNYYDYMAYYERMDEDAAQASGLPPMPVAPAMAAKVAAAPPAVAAKAVSALPTKEQVKVLSTAPR